MNDLHLLQYLFDVQGYLVIEDALNTAEVATLNRLLDVQQLPAPGHPQRFGRAPDGPGFLEWGQPFCDLLDHHRIMPILRFRLGDCFRLDRIYGIYMQQWDGERKASCRLWRHFSYHGCAARRIRSLPRRPDLQRICRRHLVLDRHRTRQGRVLLHPRQPQKQLQAASTDFRSPRKCRQRHHSRGACRFGNSVHRVPDSWHRRLGRTTRTTGSAL